MRISDWSSDVCSSDLRGREALDMLKSWNTGHPGGIATVHSNSAVAALYRLEQLVQASVVTVPRRLIAEAIDMIVFIFGRGLARRVDKIATVARETHRVEWGKSGSSRVANGGFGNKN